MRVIASPHTSRYCTTRGVVIVSMSFLLSSWDFLVVPNIKVVFLVFGLNGHKFVIVIEQLAASFQHSIAIQLTLWASTAGEALRDLPQIHFLILVGEDLKIVTDSSHFEAKH